MQCNGSHLQVTCVAGTQDPHFGRLYVTNTTIVHSLSISGYSVYWDPNIQYIVTFFAAACILLGTCDHARTNTMIYITI